MKTKLTILLLILINLLHAQTIQFISKNTDQPLSKVSVIGKDGNILAYSDIDGKIDKILLTKDQEEFQLVYDSESIAKLPYSAFENSIIKLNDRVKDIAPVIIKKGDQAKYIHVTGNFTTYVTLDKGLNCYADGIVTYIFDRENGKLKSTNVLQYRVFENKNATNEKKKVGTYEYNDFLKVPNLKQAGSFKLIKKSTPNIKELKGKDQDIIELILSDGDDHVVSFLGYRLVFRGNTLNVAFNKDSSKKIVDILNFNDVTNAEIKHKTEEKFTQITTYENFYVTEIDYSDKKNIDDVSFKRNKSNYKEKYWENTSFPNLQIIFSSYFKDDLELK